MRSLGLRIATHGGTTAEGAASKRLWATVLALALGSSVTTPALAQATGAPGTPAPAPRAGATPTTGVTTAAPSPNAPVTLPDVAGSPTVVDLAGTSPGGLTAEQVGERARATSYAAKASEQALEGAEARTDQAAMRWAPQLALKASYTRLSNLTINIPGFGYNVILDQFVLDAQLVVPISDYFLRIGKAYTAATRSEDAARHDIDAARAKSFSDGKLAYFTWLRARGAVVVAQQTLEVSRAHLKDAQNQFSVGSASKADVLRAETQVAASELALERAKSATIQAEKQVRIAMHAAADENLAPGESLESSLPPPPGNLTQLVSEGLAQRPEIKSIEKNAEAAQKQAGALNAGKYPSLSAFGEVLVANPNQRLFPPQQKWFPTWAAGAQLTWTTSDFLGAGPAAQDAEARANQLEAQKGQTRDGIELEIVQAYQSLLEADTAIETTQRQLASAMEGYRVAGELFNNGRGTGTTVVDAENALAAARFEHLNARVDARLARVRLDHALGRDVKGAAR